MMNRKKLALALAMGITTTFAGSVQADNRVSASTKGSLLIYSKIDLRWNAAGDLTQDTIIELTNDDDGILGTDVQMYFVNGDEARDAVFAGDPPQPIAEAEPGWNWVDFQVHLTKDNPVYWSAATGLPLGAAPFDILDPDGGMGPGRPTADGGRMLRGFIYLWAVDATGHAVHWNHLSGAATIVNYADQTAWEYNAWAFQSNVDTTTGTQIGSTGKLNLNGSMYALPYDVLLMDFYASGSMALSSDTVTVSIDTDLTLHPVSADLRQDTLGPITTKAKFDIWNYNEHRFSGTTRCITCWDQTLLSDYDAPNHFLIQNLQTDKGKARIDGMASTVCDDALCVLRGSDISEIVDAVFAPVCSEDAALLGVVGKELAFSGVAGGVARSGRSLVGMGTQSAQIQHDVIAPPGTLRDEALERIGALAPITGEETRAFEGSKRLDRSSRSR